MMTDDAPGVAGRYDLLEEIGRGGSARVLRAWDRRRERQVAVKVLPFDDDAVAARRRRHEVRLLASLHHPALVALLDSITDERATYLVMELMEGGTLRDRMRFGALDLAEVRAIATDAAQALAHIHAHRIVHRDVKPANLLLPAPGAAGPAVKLSDFGIAKLLDLQATRSTGVIGTAHYLSPEQAEGRVAGPATDVYSLGLTLLEACTGRPVFPGSIAESIAARLLRDPEVPSWLGPEWGALLTAMLQRDPAARPTGAEVASRAALLPDEPVDEATAPVTDTVPLVTRMPPARHVGARAAAAAAAVLLVAGAGAALAITGAPDRGAVVAAPASSAPAPSASTPSATTASASGTVAEATGTAYRASEVQHNSSSTSGSTDSSTAKPLAAVAKAAPEAKAPPAAKNEPAAGKAKGKPAKGKPLKAEPAKGKPVKAEPGKAAKGAPAKPGKGSGSGKGKP